MFLCRTCKKDRKCCCNEQKSSGPCSVCGELAVCVNCQCKEMTVYYDNGRTIQAVGMLTTMDN